MPTSFRLFVPTCMFAMILVAVDGKSDSSPCHPDTIKQRSGSSCAMVQLPHGMCGSCLQGPFYLQTNGTNIAGNYMDCTHTMSLGDSDSQCLSSLQRYVQLNPCDTVRSAALDQYVNGKTPAIRENGRLYLEYFLYTICENGCDCMPFYNTDFGNPALGVNRGNCQAHTYYDVCRSFPHIKLVRKEDSSNDDLTVLPEICPLVTKWISSPAARKWLLNGNTTVAPQVKYFIERLAEAEELLTNLTVWQSCFKLENTQGRIHPISSIDPTQAPTKFPTNFPTKLPTKFPSKTPTKSPTKAPTKLPTIAPTLPPTPSPTTSPTTAPTNPPTISPTSTLPTQPPITPSPI